MGDLFVKLDSYDKRILDALQEDGRLSNQELADRIGLSPSPCLRRERLIGGLPGLAQCEGLGLESYGLYSYQYGPTHAGAF